MQIIGLQRNPDTQKSPGKQLPTFASEKFQEYKGILL